MCVCVSLASCLPALDPTKINHKPHVFQDLLACALPAAAQIGTFCAKFQTVKSAEEPRPLEAAKEALASLGVRPALLLDKHPFPTEALVTPGCKSKGERNHFVMQMKHADSRIWSGMRHEIAEQRLVINFMEADRQPQPERGGTQITTAPQEHV